MAHADDDDGDPIATMFKTMETLSLKEKEECAGRMVALCVPDKNADTTKLAENTTKCMRLQKERNKLQKDLKEYGEDSRKKLRSIADDLDWHCRNTSAVQGVGDGATILGSTMVLAGLGSFLFGYDGVGDNLVKYGNIVNTAGLYTSELANLCQIGIVYWFNCDIQNTIITPYEEKCTILIEKNKELKPVINELNINITKYPIISKILFGDEIPPNVDKAGRLEANQLTRMPKSKKSLKNRGSSTKSETSSHSSEKRESVNNKILKTSSSCEKKIHPSSKLEHLELSVTSAISITLSCIKLCNLKQKFHTGNFSEAAIELRKIADLIQQRTVYFTL